MKKNEVPFSKKKFLLLLSVVTREKFLVKGVINKKSDA